MKKIYDNGKEAWIRSDFIKPKPKAPEKPLTDAEKLEQFDKFKKQIDFLNMQNSALHQQISTMQRDIDGLTKQAANAENYKAHYEGANKQLHTVSKDLEKKEEQVKQISLQMNGFVERATITETDVAEMRIKNRKRNGWMKQLRGCFSWRKNPDKAKRFELTESDIDNALSLLYKVIDSKL